METPMATLPVPDLSNAYAVGIAALIDCGAGSVATTGQHRVLASELEIRLVTEIYDRMRCLGERYDLHGTGLRLREANLHAAGVVGGGFRIAPAILTGIILYAIPW